MTVNQIYELNGKSAYNAGKKVAGMHMMALIAYLSRQYPFHVPALNQLTDTPRILPSDNIFIDPFESNLIDIDDLTEKAKKIKEQLLKRKIKKTTSTSNINRYTPYKGVWLYCRHDEESQSNTFEEKILSEEIQYIIDLIYNLKKQTEVFGEQMLECFQLGIFIGFLELLKNSNPGYWDNPQQGPLSKTTDWLLAFANRISNASIPKHNSTTLPERLLKPNDNIADLLFSMKEAEHLWAFPGEAEFLKCNIDYDELAFSVPVMERLNKILYEDEAKTKQIKPPLLKIDALNKVFSYYVEDITPTQCDKNKILEFHFTASDKNVLSYYRKVSGCEPIQLSWSKREAYSLLKHIRKVKTLPIILPTGQRTKYDSLKKSGGALQPIIEKLKKANINYIEDPLPPGKKNRNNVADIHTWLRNEVSLVFITIA